MPEPAAPAAHDGRRLPRLMAWLALVALLAGVFMLYLDPEFMVTVANGIWACF